MQEIVHISGTAKRRNKNEAFADCFKDRRVFTPIQCGRAIRPKIEWAIGDDTGENMSSLNACLNEMTAMYWVYKHYDELGNPKFVWFAHYQRYLEWDLRHLKPGVVFASSLILVRPVLPHFKLSLATLRESLDFSWDAIVPIQMPGKLPFGFHGEGAFDKLVSRVA